MLADLKGFFKIEFDEKKEDLIKEKKEADVRKEKEKIAKLMHENLKKEEEFEIERGRNYENKAYIALVAITLLINIPLMSIKNINFMKWLNKTTLIKADKIMRMPLIVSLKEISKDQVEFFMEFLIIGLNIVFFIFIFKSLHNFLNVILSRKMCRVGLKFYSNKALENSDNFLDYIASLNNKLMESIGILKKLQKGIAKCYDLGMFFLKRSISILLLMIILIILGGSN